MSPSSLCSALSWWMVNSPRPNIQLFSSHLASLLVSALSFLPSSLLNVQRTSLSQQLGLSPLCPAAHLPRLIRSPDPDSEKWRLTFMSCIILFIFFFTNAERLMSRAAPSLLVSKVLTLTQSWRRPELPSWIISRYIKKRPCMTHSLTLYDTMWCLRSKVLHKLKRSWQQNLPFFLWQLQASGIKFHVKMSNFKEEINLLDSMVKMFATRQHALKF